MVWLFRDCLISSTAYSDIPPPPPPRTPQRLAERGPRAGARGGRWAEVGVWSSGLLPSGRGYRVVPGAPRGSGGLPGRGPAAQKAPERPPLQPQAQQGGHLLSLILHLLHGLAQGLRGTLELQGHAWLTPDPHPQGLQAGNSRWVC